MSQKIMTKVPGAPRVDQLPSMNVADRCDNTWRGLRCQLVAGHTTAHVARDQGALISWAGHQPSEQSRRVVLAWADEA
jgi:hypothetical protein